MIKLVISSSVGIPAYTQLYEQITAQIIRGDILPDTCLPSIRGVANELKISVITVKSAYDLLEKDGYIYTVPGKGCFVKGIKDAEKEKTRLAEKRLREDLKYYADIGMTKKEFISVAEKIYPER